MKKTLATAAFLASGLAFAAAPSVPMTANNLGWYAGVGANYHGVVESRIHVPYYDPSEGIHTLNFRLNNSQIGLNVFAGNRLTTHFGTEGGLNWIGDYSYKSRTKITQRLTPPEQEPEHQRPIVQVINNYHLYYDAVFFQPLTHDANHNFTAIARAGVGFMHTKNKFNKAAGQVVYHDWNKNSNSLSTFALNWGAGLQYSYRDVVSFRALYSHVQPSHDADDLYAIPDTINLDAIYHFG